MTGSSSSDGYAIIEQVSTKNGKTILHPMKVDFPQRSITAILGASSAAVMLLALVALHLPLLLLSNCACGVTNNSFSLSLYSILFPYSQSLPFFSTRQAPAVPEKARCSRS